MWDFEFLKQNNNDCLKFGYVSEDRMIINEILLVLKTETKTTTTKSPTTITTTTTLYVQVFDFEIRNSCLIEIFALGYFMKTHITRSIFYNLSSPNSFSMTPLFLPPTQGG